MDPEQVLLELWKGSRARVRERRGYEWKIAFGVWGAQLAAIALLLARLNKLELGVHYFPGKYFAAGACLTVLHGFYVFGFIRNNNYRDSCLARAYEADLHTALGNRISAETEGVFGERPTAPRGRAPYSAANFFEVGVTAFLATIAPLAVANLG